MKELELKLDNSWVANAEAWTQSVRENRIESRKLVTNQAVRDEIIRYRPSRVLDVGCGEGWLARTLSEEGIDVVGIDGSRELIEMAQSAGGGRFLSLHYADLRENASQLGGSFDVIVCNFSLLGQDIQGILQSLAALLASHGVLIVQTLHPFSAMQNDRYEDGWREETFSGMGEGYRSSMPWYFRTIGSWLGEVQTAGFRLLQCQEPVHPATGMPLSLIITASKE